MKFAGYDYILIDGKADQPSYIQIYNDEVAIRDASHIWGKTAFETERFLKDEWGDKNACAAVIGPAGERLSNLATVQNDYYHQFGRGGAGAVMGSKNIKGIVIRGTGAVRVAHPQAFIDFLLDTMERKIQSGIETGTLAARMKYGTPLTLNITSVAGILPTLNFKYGDFEDATLIDGHAFRKKVIADTACFGCSIGCSKHSKAQKGVNAGAIVGGPEYETIALFGANLGNADADSIIYVNSLCDDLGLDTIGTGNVIGWAMECYERGIISAQDLDGLDLRFGNIEAAIRLIHMIAYREGLGDTLAKGVRAASQEIGQGSEAFSMHVKGLEYPAYRPGPRSPGFGLTYAITERGACHRRAWPTLKERSLPPFSSEGRASLVKALYDQRIPWHCALMCDVPVLLLDLAHADAAKMLSTVTGWDFTSGDMQDLSERVASLIRAFNIRAGATREDDTLAPRSFEPESSGPAAGRTLTRTMTNRMIQEYYALRGWDTEGVPTKRTLENLGLTRVAQDLHCGIQGERPESS
jgi:aldehyde:ferredoxin oxidoreductase